VWKLLRDLLPDAWMTAFPEQLPPWARRPVESGMVVYDEKPVSVSCVT
jgi:hypothetical protein